MKKILLSVAGFDPSSGAGVLLDLKVFQEFGFQGMSILTSLTAQNTKEVQRIHALPSRFLWEQYKTLEADVSFSGIKVGMIGSKDNIRVVSQILSRNKNMPRVVDPVFKSSEGAWLLKREFIPGYISAIGGKASLLTPNLEEAQLISGNQIKNPEDLKAAAEKIYFQTKIPCLIKGLGIRSTIMDLLYDGTKFYSFENEKIKKRVHGTGCFLSSSILGFLAEGHSLGKACLLASRFTHRARQEAIKPGMGRYIIPFPRERKSK
ncbi:MAG: bifunctional hydroxymethylpyrimidine kinase/phosphomethylpyrimidine kinase [Candidatus Aminicenantes bacterium]|nr:bifunctional hydroxymethylpyrimidine kinase/phosphomethylpyrimidine kinase [Candidatus Aminicenantes bacterium]